MCTTCGCGQGETRLEGDGKPHAHAHPHEHEHDHEHTHADGTVHSHPHPHAHDHAHGQGKADHGHDDLHGPGEPHDHGHGPRHGHRHGHTHLHFGLGAAKTSAPGMGQRRLLQIERSVLAKNDALAGDNRALFAGRGILALNLVSSPGSGKTTLLVETLKRLGGRWPVAVIEGDQQTTFDADRIRETGAPALQINTGKGCHLDAQMIGRAVARLGPAKGSILFIENVGNLVCPSGFDLGEAHKVVILSVTEGEDKPLKYPDMFAASSLMLLNKADLLPHLSFDVDQCLAFARRVNPTLRIIRTSSTTGEGLDEWISWIEAQRSAPGAPPKA